jgi:hypothetical protein
VTPIPTDVATVVAALVEEGCVGETVGAAEVRESARCTSQAALVTAFAKIAEDEERHAALAWRSLQWMLDTFGEAARIAAERAFERSTLDPGIDPEEGLVVNEALGVLSARTRGALRRDGNRALPGGDRA